MTEQQTTFSVIIPVYKVKEYLHRCLNSLRDQTFSDFEAIMVDDGSPDDCGKTCDEYAAADPRFKAIHQQNKGLSGARNTGIAAAQGKYLVFIDSDDHVKPQLLKKLSEAITSNHEPDVILYGYTSVNKKESKTFIPEPCSLEKIKLRVLEDDWKAYAWNKCFKRAFFKYEFPLGKKFEDLYITPIILWEAESISLVQESLYIYNCLNENSITATRSSATNFALLQSRLHILDYVIENKIDKAYKEVLANVIRDARRNTIKCLAGMCPEDNYYQETLQLLHTYHEQGLITDFRDKFWLKHIFKEDRFWCKLYVKYRNYET